MQRRILFAFLMLLVAPAGAQLRDVGLVNRHGYATLQQSNVDNDVPCLRRPG